MTSARGETALFCWGSTSHGQLGLGGIEEEQIFSPRQLHAFDDRQVQEIACGQEHTLFLLEDGMLYSCGNNDTCQLGHSKSRTRPETIDTLEAQVIRHVSCGDSHSVAVTDAGEVFAWGNNRHGQLGCGSTDVIQSKTPKLVRSLSSSVALQVVCGSQHTLALMRYGDVFAWGGNSYGQLGIGNVKDNVYDPQLLTGLRGLTLTRVAAGGAHSFALTVSGALFGWGRNHFGQLGVGDEVEHLSPTLCETLRSHKVKYMTCGQCHSAVITEEGGVFTFGAGMFGQLGHNAPNSETLPKKVFELMGSEVSQLVCGRQHSVVYLPQGGRLCSFGLGANGQLGIGTASNSPGPAVVKGPFVPAGQLSSGTDIGSWVIKHISSAGDQCFVVVTAPHLSIASDDFRIIDPECQVAVLSEERLNKYSSIPAERSPPVKLAADIRSIFSSLSSLNGSFLLSCDNHYNCGSTRHGVNIAMAVNYFAQLAKMSNSVLLLEMQEGLKLAVCANMSLVSQDVEAMRSYLILPYCHLFDEPQLFQTIIAPFSRGMLEFKHATILEQWLGSAPPEQFTRYVHVYKEMLIYLLAESSPSSIHEPGRRSSDLQLCLDVLSRLHKVNEDHGQLIPYETFHISVVKDKTDLRVDYVKWLQRTATEVINLGQMTVDRQLYIFGGSGVFMSQSFGAATDTAADTAAERARADRARVCLGDVFCIAGHPRPRVALARAILQQQYNSSSDKIKLISP
ncbi:putative E3 ubiquitin-protein ligase HERC4 [Lamellibrachia satsuma]|nr:putative E3 ubiquitin-protein ligase HERC4 [Lamellibrachia satsuma]